MTYRISKNNKTLKGKIIIPQSKSESNRVLLIKALSANPVKINNLSDSDDTIILHKALKKISDNKNCKNALTVDAGAAGTAMRFLTAFLSIKEGKYLLTGSEQMKKRPIGVLVDALNTLGANIEYAGKKGFPPLKITGSVFKKSEIIINGNISSQYISALLMIAPILKNGLEISIKGELVSKPYVEMTLKIMKHFGIKYSWKENKIEIKNQEYKSSEFDIGGDWSGVSYWYEMAAFSDEVDLTIEGLLNNNLQGDSVVSKIFEKFGVKTKWLDENAIHLLKEKPKINEFEYDFIGCPDIAQTLAVTCAGLNIKATLKGLSNLNIKETRRLDALHTELKKFEYKTKPVRRSALSVQRKSEQFTNSQIHNFTISTYNDHRMAMSFAPLAILLGEIKIENPDVVTKSYPNFWNDLKSVGFKIEEI
ncbi:MAG: 3-phosphoshikimate 1-carboxyvinyltransferase [Bacteroidales bacterium]|nr:3-phosphoshikimate 1-carboxyvinyltransferase [Bacteroidales bacterium]